MINTTQNKMLADVNVVYIDIMLHFYNEFHYNHHGDGSLVIHKRICSCRCATVRYFSFGIQEKWSDFLFRLFIFII